MKREPVLIIAAIIAILQVVTGALTDHLEITSITAAITAIGAVFQRSQVTPVKKKKRPRKA
jgi:hypothetical protein